MSPLLRAELARTRARSFVWFVAALVVVAGLGLVVSAWDDTRPPSAEQVAIAQQQVDAAHRQWLDRQDDVASCEDLVREADPTADVDAVCAYTGPTLEDYLPHRPSLEELGTSRLAPMAWIVALGMLAIGTSVVSADFTTGAMGTWLTFAPRRGRVLSSKVGAVLVVGLPVSVVAVGTVLGGIVVVSAVNGAVGSPATSFWTGTAALVARQVALGLWAGVVGVGLGFALRHAAAVAGLVVWWVAGIESALPLLVPMLAPVTLRTNVSAWVYGGADYLTEECGPDPWIPGGELCEQIEHHVSTAQGGLMLLAAAAVVLGAGLLLFRRRDVT